MNEVNYSHAIGAGMQLQMIKHFTPSEKSAADPCMKNADNSSHQTKR
jgi:hypothetical protein